MQLRPLSSSGSEATDIAGAIIETASSLGHLPVITQYTPHGRLEQSAASIAQWVAKGAHFWELDAMLAPGDAIYLDAPPSWAASAVALSAWWAGLVVVQEPGIADVAVVGEDRPAPAGDVFRIGDAIDGSPVQAAAEEPWTNVVQTFPDQPPAPRANAEAAATGQHTQAELIAFVRTLDSGRLGVELDAADQAGSDMRVRQLAAVALRPFVTGQPSVIVDRVSREAAAAEKVANWL